MVPVLVSRIQPHHPRKIQQFLDIKARIPNITVRDAIVPVEHRRLDFERRLISFGRSAWKSSFSSLSGLHEWRTMGMRKSQAKRRRKGPCPVAPLQGTLTVPECLPLLLLHPSCSRNPPRSKGVPGWMHCLSSKVLWLTREYELMMFVPVAFVGGRLTCQNQAHRGRATNTLSICISSNHQKLGLTAFPVSSSAYTLDHRPDWRTSPPG